MENSRACINQSTLTQSDTLAALATNSDTAAPVTNSDAAAGKPVH